MGESDLGVQVLWVWKPSGQHLMGLALACFTLNAHAKEPTVKAHKPSKKPAYGQACITPVLLISGGTSHLRLARQNVVGHLPDV